jgi:hypothetical protein
VSNFNFRLIKEEGVLSGVLSTVVEIFINVISSITLIASMWGLAAFSSFLWNATPQTPQIAFEKLTTEPLTIVIGVAAGISFFTLRCRYPIAYGLTEIFVAILSIFYSTTPAVVSGTGRFFALLGGIYIFVRGLDNIDKRMKANHLWNSFFHGSAQGRSSGPPQAT